MIFKIQFKIPPADFTAVNPHSSLTPFLALHIDEDV